MSGSVEKTLFLKADLHKIVHKKEVKLRDALELEIAGKAMYEQISNLLLMDFSKYDKDIEVFSILDVVKLIHENFPGLTVESIGEQDFILEYVPIQNHVKVPEILRLIFICVLTFFGAAFTIMAFNNDISILGVFERFYMQNIGEKKPTVSELEICYSIGIALGITVFFNHFGHKKITPDPTPIQVEMRKYEKDRSNTFIETKERKGHCRNVD